MFCLCWVEVLIEVDAADAHTDLYYVIGVHWTEVVLLLLEFCKEQDGLTTKAHQDWYLFSFVYV